MRIGAGRFKGRPLPAVRDARPISSRLKTSLFGVLAPRLSGARVLDVCAGAGALGLEALSRGAREVILLDVDRRKVRALNDWLGRVDPGGPSRAVGGNWQKGPLPPGPFDLIFLDPPFVTWSETAMARGTHEAGFLRLREIVAPQGRLVVKVPQRLPPLDLAAWTSVRRGRAGDSAYVIWAPDSVKA